LSAPNLFDDEIKTKVRFEGRMEISEEEIEEAEGDLESVIINALGGIAATLIDWEEE
jgi:hypothetical protein